MGVTAPNGRWQNIKADLTVVPKFDLGLSKYNILFFQCRYVASRKEITQNTSQPGARPAQVFPCMCGLSEYMILYHKIGNDESQKLCAESPSEASLYHSS